MSQPEPDLVGGNGTALLHQGSCGAVEPGGADKDLRDISGRSRGAATRANVAVRGQRLFDCSFVCFFAFVLHLSRALEMNFDIGYGCWGYLLSFDRFFKMVYQYCNLIFIA